jgi:predicted Zn-dependent protease
MSTRRLSWPRIAAVTFVSAGLMAAHTRAQESLDPVQLVQQGRRLNAAGKQSEALTLYAQALRLKPDLFDAHLASGIALDLLGRYAEARTHLTRAIELAPEEARNTALSAMAVSFAFERNAPEAARFYQRAFDADSSARKHGAAAETANALGRLYLETGDARSARRWYETGYETARRQPDEPGSQLKLWEFRWLHAQARIAAREGKWKTALERLRAARTLVKSSSELADQGPTVAYLEGYVAFYRHDYANALAALAHADQNDPFILMLVAEAQQQSGHRGEARRTWEQVLTFNGHSLQNAFSRPAAKKALNRK